MSVMTSSLFLPPPDPVFGCKPKMVDKRLMVSFWALVMSALSCIPKASGNGFKGKSLIYFKNSA